MQVVASAEGVKSAAKKAAALAASVLVAGVSAWTQQRLQRDRRGNERGERGRHAAACAQQAAAARSDVAGGSPKALLLLLRLLPPCRAVRQRAELR